MRHARTFHRLHAIGQHRMYHIPNSLSLLQSFGYRDHYSPDLQQDFSAAIVQWNLITALIYTYLLMNFYVRWILSSTVTADEVGVSLISAKFFELFVHPMLVTIFSELWVTLYMIDSSPIFLLFVNASASSIVFSGAARFHICRKLSSKVQNVL